MTRIRMLIVAVALPLLSFAGEGLRLTPLPNQRLLPVARVRRIMEDGEGFIWYATAGGGLCRDYGYGVDVFRPSREGDGGLSAGVLCLAEDGAGRVWFGTEDGLYYVDKAGGFAVHEADTALRGEAVQSVAAMSDGTLWAGLRGRLRHYDLRGKGLTREYAMRDSLGHPLLVPCMAEDSRGELVGCASWNVGLFVYEAESDSIRYLPWGVEGSPQWMVEDRAGGCYWVATWGRGVVQYRREGTGGKVVSEGEGLAIHVNMGTDGTLWVCTVDRLRAYSAEGGRLAELPLEGLPLGERPAVEATECDSRGNVWVASLSPTSFVLSRSDEGMERTSFGGGAEAFTAQSVAEHVVAEAGGTWLYVSRFGIVCLPSEGGKPLVPEGATELLGACLAPASEGGVWTKQSKTIVRLRREGHGIASERVSYAGQDVNSLLDDGRGSLWVAGTERLQRLDTRTGRLATVAETPNGAYSLCTDGRGTVYCIARKVGVMRADSRGGASVVCRGDDFNGLACDGNGTFFASTADGTVFTIPKGDSIASPSPALSGLRGERIVRLAVDSVGHLWALTDQSASEYNTRTGVRRTLHCNDRGVSLDYFTDIIPARGGVVLCGPGAVVAVRSSSSLTDRHRAPRPRVVSVTYNGVRHLLPALGDEAVSLPSGAKDISIELTTLDYLGARQVAFRYRGTQGGPWTELPEGVNTLHYSSLPAGTLRLEVEATLAGGAYTTEPLRISLRRAPAWWESWWFRTLLALAVAATLVAVLIRWSKGVKARGEARMERRLTELKLRFFTNVSHELRTPLTLIATPLESIADNLRSDRASLETLRPFILKRIANAEAHVRQLTRMINTLLDFRKLELGQTRLELSPGDIMELTLNACESFRPLAQRQGIDLQTSLTPPSLCICFDQMKMQHVLTNLLSNALKYTKAGGSVRVNASLAGDGDTILISVSDTGVGIREEELSHVFDRYYQASNTAAASTAGTGIGLHIVREFTEMHGGSVTATSKQGQGSTFTVSLPTGLRLEAEQGQESPSPEGQGQAGKPSVLVADDNEQLRKLLCEELADSYTVSSATDGEEALAMLRSKDVDVLVSDVAMPRMDGFTLCRLLRQDLATCHLLIVLLTAKAGDESRLQGYEAGADAYLVKPFSIKVLRARIAALIEQRRRRHEAFSHDGSVPLEEAAVCDMDRDFLRRAKEIVSRHLQEEQYDVDAFASDLGMSRSSLYRKLQAVSGQSPREFIRNVRLRRAADLLRSGGMSISEVAYAVGFGYVSHFCKCFKDMYGTQPGQYAGKRETLP